MIWNLYTLHEQTAELTRYDDDCVLSLVTVVYHV